MIPANVDDGTCDFAPYGCTDSTALNYNSAAQEYTDFDGGKSDLNGTFFYYLLENINELREGETDGAGSRKRFFSKLCTWFVFTIVTPADVYVHGIVTLGLEFGSETLQVANRNLRINIRELA